jgi:hypothetical protein
VSWRVVHGDCRHVLPNVPADSIDASVTDPPYELGFMGKSWDKSGVSFQPATWAETYRVLKPGARLLAFGGSRTSHRIVCAIEDAGFIIEDGMEYFFSVEEQARELWETLDDSQRDALAVVLSAFMGGISWVYGTGWSKHRSKLKPAHEPICVARKGASSALNIDACRVSGGRWPANILFDEAAAEVLDEQAGILTSGANPIRRHSPKTKNCYGTFNGGDEKRVREVDSGGASRFFYTAKASRKEREAGLEDAPKRRGGSNEAGFTKDVAAGLDRNRPVGNYHPTVKPIALMRYLVKADHAAWWTRAGSVLRQRYNRRCVCA